MKRNTGLWIVQGLLAAGGLVIIMTGATIINIVNGMAVFAITAVLGLMAAYVVWGRWWSART